MEEPNRERFVSISECGNRTTWKIKLSSIHRFDEKNHKTLKSYKFDSPNGKVLVGTINKIASKF